jgi:membrane-associated PAP2 superfamily phosphatase
VGARSDFLLRHLGPALLVLIVLLALDRTGVDSAVSRWFFDPVARTFPLRHNASLEVFGHQAPKLVVALAGSCVIALLLVTFALPELRPQRRLLVFLSLSLALAPLAVVLLKAGSVRHCPWSLQEFGGYAPRLSLLDALPPGVEPGRCFPSGHAAAGFCLVAFYFAGLSLGRPRAACAGFWSAVAAGMGLGMVRVVQGAHFISHNFWAALVCWLVILGLYVAIMDVPGRAQSMASTG